MELKDISEERLISMNDKKLETLCKENGFGIETMFGRDLMLKTLEREIYVAKLRKMTRGELWSTDWLTLIKLCEHNGIKTTNKDSNGEYTMSSLCLLPKIEKLRVEIQKHDNDSE